MSDFSELCPLFNTGVYSELTLADVSFTSIGPTRNALGGPANRSVSPGSLKFQRTVIVTKVFVQKLVTGTTGLAVCAVHHKATGTAAGTIFASVKMSSTVTVPAHVVGRIKSLTQAANKTFLAADVLGFCGGGIDTAAAVRACFIVRYKEK
jgi:hypothetical protein